MPLWRDICALWSLWRAWSQEAYIRSQTYCQLGNGITISGIASSFKVLHFNPFSLINIQLIHSVALLVATSFTPQSRIAASLFTTGMTMFSGSIYLLVLDPDRFKIVGPVTPLGGLCLIGGWIALAFGKRLPLQRPPTL
jgi:uncharacterized membrane protein YgdD (TMEM256/DUF423 family)